MTRREFIHMGTASVAIVAALGLRGIAEAAAQGKFPVTMTDAEWRRKLSPAAYATLRRDATERPGTSPLLKEHRAGTFQCLGCANPLFSSRTKYDSGTGWPSFWQPLPRAVGEESDTKLGYERTEVHCARCGGHLGHKFDDGPQPTGLRYCMNGVAMRFVPGKA